MIDDDRITTVESGSQPIYRFFLAILRFTYQYQVPRSRLVEKKWATYKILVDHYFAPLKLPFWIILGYTSLLDKPNSWLLWTPLPSHLPVGCLMIKFGSGRVILSCGICKRTQGPESHLNQPCKWPSFSFWVLCFSTLLELYQSQFAYPLIKHGNGESTETCNDHLQSPAKSPRRHLICSEISSRIFHVPSPRVYSRANCPKICMADHGSSVRKHGGSDGSTISSGHIKRLPTSRQNQGF